MNRFDFIECFTTTFLRAHSWLNWVDNDMNRIMHGSPPNNVAGFSQQSLEMRQITMKLDLTIIWMLRILKAIYQTFYLVAKW